MSDQVFIKGDFSKPFIRMKLQNYFFKIPITQILKSDGCHQICLTSLRGE